jgi:hypothetical protein
VSAETGVVAARANADRRWRLGARRQVDVTAFLTVVLVVLLLIGLLPVWPYSGGWGYYPSGGLGLLLIIVLIVVLLGRRGNP